MTRLSLRGAKLPGSPSNISGEPGSEAKSPEFVDGLVMLPWGAAGRGSRASLPLSDKPSAHWGSYPSGLRATPTSDLHLHDLIHVLPLPFLPLSGARAGGLTQLRPGRGPCHWALLRSRLWGPQHSPTQRGGVVLPAGSYVAVTSPLSLVGHQGRQHRG